MSQKLISALIVERETIDSVTFSAIFDYEFRITRIAIDLGPSPWHRRARERTSVRDLRMGNQRLMSFECPLRLLTETDLDVSLVTDRLSITISKPLPSILGNKIHPQAVVIGYKE